jgi:predicted O-methyltransferase YrrM
MSTFEEAMKLTRGISSETALDDAEAKGLYDACKVVPLGGLVIEVGCQLGRSSSLIAQVAQERHFHSVHIDNYKQQPDYLQAWVKTMWEIGGDDEHRFTLLCMRTEQALWLIEQLADDDGISLAFIDGDHEYPGVMIDLEALCPLIAKGGLLTMHDYGRDSLPGVYKAASEFLKPDQWEHVGTYGTLGVWRKL